MGTEEENRKAQESLDKQATEGSMAAKMLGGKEASKEKPEPVKKAKGGMIGSASKRADGIAIRGKTRA